MTAFKDAHANAIAQLEAHEPLKALAQLRPLFSAEIDDDDWGACWNLVADVAGNVGDEDVQKLSRGIVGTPNDLDALFDFAYQLIESGLAEVSIAPLLRAHRLAPTDAKILLELAHAFEVTGHNGRAVEFLVAAPDILEASFFARYLTAFNAVMANDVALAKTMKLSDREDPEEAFMAKRIEDWFWRLKQFPDIDGQSLRDWQFVTTASTLLHVSPYGFDEGMSGRYAYTQDSEETIREGIEALVVCLQTLGISPPVIYGLGDRESEIVGRALAKRLDVGFETFANNAAEGIVVAYDLNALSEENYYALRSRAPKQFVWTHVVDWRQPPPFAPDFHTLQYQYNTTPWEPGIPMGDMPAKEPDESPATVIAERIVALPCEFDREELDVFLKKVVASEHDPVSLANAEQARSPFWEGSPVKSSYFA